MQRKIIILVVVSVLLSLASVGILSYLSVRSSINHSFEDHAMMASMLGRQIDYNLETNITRLLDLYLSGVINMNDDDWEPEKEALRTAYKYSIFSGGIFMVSHTGDVLLTYPYRLDDMVNALSVPAIERALFSGNVAVSDVYTDSRTMKKTIFVVVPLKDTAGVVIGAVGGRIDPTNYVFSQVISNVTLGKETIVELVDSRGAVIASNRLDRILTLSDHNKFMEELISDGQPVIVRCHRCHTDGEGGSRPQRADILAFSPLSSAPWGVAVRLPEESAFRPTSYLFKTSAVIGILLIASAILLAAVLSRRIAKPVSLLTEATRKIAAGDFTRPVRVKGEDEVGELAESLESMRRRLAILMEESQSYSSMLESEVHQRTQELLYRKKQLAALLDELIRTQEEERRRIAQELHDDTAQTIAAMGMSIEIASVALAEDKLEPDMLMELRGKVGGLLDGIGRIIKNLRPPLLDDLGLEAALEWMLERHLKSRGIGYYLDIEGIGPDVFDTQAEMCVFRIIQEAMFNAAKHSEATHVTVHMRRSGKSVDIEIIDDGVGFDVAKVTLPDERDMFGGFGLLGIRERVAQLEGELEIASSPGEGTAIYIKVPVSGMEVRNAENKPADS